MLGKEVTVIIDRPLGSVHPEHKDIFYSINYGYVPGIIASDGEEQDAYVLGVEEPIETFTGKVVAIIHRIGDEDKWIVASKEFSKKEIIEKTRFQEQYFESFIELEKTHCEDLIDDIIHAGIQRDDVLMIHSSLKSFGHLIGGAETVIKAFQTIVSEGMLIFPTHTWATIRNNGDVFDVNETPSCVGALTNVARNMQGFKRSSHPTHSVCAWGKNSEQYLKCDDNATSPVSVTGCFGVLPKYNAKIVFLGAPLSKNTFIHSIEEECLVEDRFTSEQFTFFSKNQNEIRTYVMPRHFSTKSAHISDHYEKLLPEMLKRGIAKKVWIGNSQSHIVDSRRCADFVRRILEQDIHFFDDYRQQLGGSNENYKKAK